jgi:hypothetical protein
MLYWLIGLVVMLLVWARIWQSNPKMAFGVLLGLPLAWVFSRLTAPYFSGEAQVPVWLPPLPLAIVAITLFVFGALVWIRGTRHERRPDDPRHH